MKLFSIVAIFGTFLLVVSAQYRPSGYTSHGGNKVVGSGYRSSGGYGSDYRIRGGYRITGYQGGSVHRGSGYHQGSGYGHQGSGYGSHGSGYGSHGSGYGSHGGYGCKLAIQNVCHFLYFIIIVFSFFRQKGHLS